MELQFEKQELAYLAQVLRTVKDQELTQEIRLGESMPDVGRVLAGWGQPVLRSKEWQGGQVGASGGVMVWVLYEPEDGTDPRVVEGWIPFQIRADVQSDREGLLRILPLVRFVDGRNISARKILVRAGLSCLVEGLCRQRSQISRAPEELPEDVHLLRRSYPIRLPREAGEKAFDLEETMKLDGAAEILSSAFRPMGAEGTVHGDKAAIRGEGRLHLVYRCNEGRIRTVDVAIPFSQLGELEGSFDSSAQTDVIMAVTGLEVSLVPEGLAVHASLVAQYMISDRCMIELTQDAYSSRREVGLRQEELMLPALLDEMRERVTAQSAFPHAREGVDLTFWPGFPKQRREGDRVELSVPGRFQLLGRDQEGKLRGWNGQWEENLPLNAHETSRIDAIVQGVDGPQMLPAGEGTQARAQTEVQAAAVSRMGLPMITSLELGALRESDECRPSLILCRGGGRSLWELAKGSGSTVDAIRSANGIGDDDQGDRMLLIPVS